MRPARPVVIIAFIASLFACSSTSHSDLALRPDTGSVIVPVSDATYEAPAVPVDIFAGAPDFTPRTPASSSSLVNRHIAHTGKTLTGTNCNSCHDGKSSETPTFAYGGTVYYAPDGKEVAPGVEIRVVDAAGSVTVVYSDQGGNFWRIGDATTFAYPAHTGARTAVDVQLMTADFDKVGCNQSLCHDGSDDYPRITIRKDPTGL